MTQRHETQTPETPGAVALAFDSARRDVVSLTSDPAFHDACLRQNPKIDQYDDMDKPAYWDTFANFSYEVTTKAAQESGPNLDLEAKQLLAETPRYLFASMQLENKAAMGRQEKDYARSIASYYNQLLRTFAYNHPESHVEDVKKGLLAMVNISMEDQVVRQSAAREVYSALRGAQHELAFGQILAHTGKEFYAATTEQDLAGMDYIVATGQDRWLGLDVKASDRLMASGRNQQLFAVRDVDQVIVHSLTTEAELGGTFFTSEETAAAKAPYLNELIAKAAKLSA